MIHNRERRSRGEHAKAPLEPPEEQHAKYTWTDADRKAIWDHLEAEMKAGNLRYVSDELKRKANRTG